MNLINDPWIPVIRKDGSRERIAPWQVAETENPVIEIAAPRPDFQGALYQFLIGLLQTTFAPADDDEWFELWQAIDVQVLQQALVSFAAAFEWQNPDGPSFLQDYATLEDAPKPLAALLIEAPGGKTLKDNLDHFVKGGVVAGACAPCSATALFTLQTNAPSGGVGHRVGVRGGGPLTTLLVPAHDKATLWQKLWLNIRTEDNFVAKAQNPSSDIFPWLAPTRISDKKGVATLPDDVHALQMYWGMPRRMQIEAPDGEGNCTLCGEKNTPLFYAYRTKNYGVDYNGPWVHSLTPYRFDPKNEKLPLSIKGQQGGLGYRHWLNLNWQDPELGDHSAIVVREFYRNKLSELGNDFAVQLWAFGYDMDNMKARCWYESTLPVVAVNDDYREQFLAFVATLINAAKDCMKELRSQVKAAWFSRPKDAKGDTTMVDASFWEATEAEFYQHLRALADETRFLPSTVAKQWRATLVSHCIQLFDHWVLEGDAEDLDMKRITKARRDLVMRIPKIKAMKDLKQIAQAQEEVS